MQGWDQEDVEGEEDDGTLGGDDAYFKVLTILLGTQLFNSSLYTLPTLGS